MTTKENVKLLGRLIEESMDSLKFMLMEKLCEENLRYEYLSEEFAKSFELSRIKLLGNVRSILHTELSELETSFKNKDRLLLHQMKSLVNNKLKHHIQRLNTELNPLHKQAIIDKILLLNESLQKIENTFLQGDYSVLSPNMTINDISVISHAEEVKNESKTKPPLITPTTLKINPKFDSNAASGLTPLLSESAERKFKPDFKTPYQQEEKNQRQRRDEAVTSGPAHHVDKTPNSFNKTDNKVSSGNSGREQSSNQAGVTLFDMFDQALNSITNNNSQSPKQATLPEQKEKKDSSAQIKTQKLFLLIIKSYFKTWRQQAKRIYPQLTATPLLERSQFNSAREEFGRSLFSSTDELGCKTENKSFLNTGEKGFFSLAEKSCQNTTEKAHPLITAEKSFQNTGDKSSNDLSMIFLKEDIIQDYTSNNLLCTHLSFCEGKLKEMDGEELLDLPSKKKKDKKKGKLQKQETPEPDSGYNSLKESTRSSGDLKKGKDTPKPTLGKKILESKKTGKETPREPTTATFRTQESTDLQDKMQSAKRSDSANPARRSQIKQTEMNSTNKKTVEKKPAVPKFEKKSTGTTTTKPNTTVTSSSNKENENKQNKSSPKPRATQLTVSK